MSARHFKLVFECCGVEVFLGTTKETGKHGDYCLSCDTPNPATRVEEDDRY